MDELNIDTKHQSGTPQKDTSEKEGLARWAAIGSHKILTIVLLIVSAAMALSALILLEPCHGGLGCVVLYPFYIVSLPIQPVLWLVSEIIDKFTYSYYTFYGMPSVLKFLPALILSTAAFLLGYVATHLFLRLKKSKDGIEKCISNIRLARRNFVFYNIVFILLFSGYIFVQAPPAPFASDSAMVKSCRSYEQCYQNYIHSEIENCQKDKAMFVYPLETSLPTIDQCVFESFSEKKLFENISLSHGSGGGTIITSSKQGTTVSSPRYQMDILLNMFLDQLVEAEPQQRKSFCEAFSDEVQTGYIAGGISNKEYCVQKLGLVPENESNLVNLCTVALTRESWTQSDLQKRCFTKFASFQTYDPSPSIYDEFFGEGWQYISFQPGSAIYDSLSKKDSETLDVAYRLNVRKRYEGLGKFDDLRISQGSVDGLLHNDFLDLSETQKEIKTTGSPEERTGVTEETILGNEVLIEHRIEHRNTGDRTYDIFHFVKNGTYIQLDGEYIYYLDDKDKDLLFRKITEDILSR